MERQAQKSRWFQSFCPRPFILIENTKRERWVESGNANYSSALPLLCFRNGERGTRRSFNSHHQHRAMLANLTAQSNHSWHTGSFTPSNILPLLSVFYWKYYSSPCELEDALQISVFCWFSSRKKKKISCFCWHCKGCLCLWSTLHFTDCIAFLTLTRPTTADWVS